ncbi:hypothetical protein [Roseovarius sp. D22-M7]|uniref:hypothetical protein n=1 Tax=Roseovarius sp. D22-M7 TaxID=3127116 RepID=UPI00300FB452
MDKQDKHAWLTEVAEDMIIYCARNELFETGAILQTARRVLVSEVTSQNLRSKKRLEALKKVTKIPQ